MKNHKVGISPIKDLAALVAYICENEVIYFAPAGKVIPTKFFIGWSWNNKKALIKHLEYGSFHSCKSYDSIITKQIRQVLQQCPAVINKRVV